MAACGRIKVLRFRAPALPDEIADGFLCKKHLQGCWRASIPEESSRTWVGHR